eukprot:3239867-Pyramimonas_sp.AAC.1
MRKGGLPVGGASKIAARPKSHPRARRSRAPSPRKEPEGGPRKKLLRSSVALEPPRGPLVQ